MRESSIGEREDGPRRGKETEVGLSFVSIIEEEWHYNILYGLTEGRKYTTYHTIYFTIRRSL